MKDNKPANSRIAKNSILMGIRMVIVLLISLYTTRVVLSTLGVIDYGIYNVVCGFVGMFTFLNASMSNATQRFYNFELGRNGIEGASKVYHSSVLIQLTLSIILVLLIEAIGVWYLYNKMVLPNERIAAAFWIMQFSIISFFLTFMKVPFSAAVMAHEKMDFYAVLGIFDTLLKLVAVVLLPYIAYDRLITYGALYLLVTVVDFVLFVIYSRHNFSEIGSKFTNNKELTKDILSFTGWNLFGSFSMMMKEQGLSMIMNLFFGPIVNAARGIANQINSAISGFIFNITTPVKPQVVQSYAVGDIDRTIQLTFSMCKLSCYFYYMMALPVCLEIDFILNMWLGDTIPNHTSSFVIITVATCFTSNLHASISGVVHATGKMKAFQVLTSSIKLFSVILAYLSFLFGSKPEVALIIVMMVDICAHVSGLFVVRKLIEFRILSYIRIVVMPILIVVLLSTLVPALLKQTIPPGIIQFLLVVSVSVLSVSIFTYFLGLDQKEKRMLGNIICNFKNKITKRI